MSGHTPGPWRSEGYAVLGPNINGDVQVIVDDKAWARGAYYRPTATQAKANAHLIAAAPEMKEAGLLLLAGCHDETFHYGHRLTKAQVEHLNGAILAFKTAIAKAEGRQP